MIDYDKLTSKIIDARMRIDYQLLKAQIAVKDRQMMRAHESLCEARRIINYIEDEFE